MADNEIVIEAKERTVTGKGYARQLRRQGMIPGNLVEKGKSTSIELDPKWLSRAWQNGRKFTMDMGGNKRVVKMQEMQIHPVKRLSLIHI